MHPTPKSFGLIHTCIIYIYIYIYIQYLLNAPHPKKLWLDPYLYYIYIYTVPPQCTPPQKALA